MDSNRWTHFKALVDALITRVGASEVVDEKFSFGEGEIVLTPQAFEAVCGSRTISQQFKSGWVERSFTVNDCFRLYTSYPIPQPRPTTAHGEYIDLCCEHSEEEVKTVLSEQTVVAAEAVTDAT